MKEEAQIRNKEIKEDLERENFGLKQSLENKERTLERLGGYLKR